LRTAHWDKDTPCWEWPGQKNKHGYGIIDREDEEYFAHRLIYKTLVGKLIDGLCIMHRCDNPSCVNPAHLVQGTWAENNKDRAAKGRSGKHRALKTHCKRGHEYVEGSFYYSESNGKIKRNCKECCKERMRKFLLAKASI
jgi:hypothetical protein